MLRFDMMRTSIEWTAFLVSRLCRIKRKHPDTLLNEYDVISVSTCKARCSVAIAVSCDSTRALYTSGCSASSSTRLAMCCTAFSSCARIKLKSVLVNVVVHVVPDGTIARTASMVINYDDRVE